jgi:hypothetical protein
MKKIFFSAAFLVFVIINFVFQFWLWANTPNQNPLNIKSSVIEKYGWSIFSFPTFWMFSNKVINEYFMNMLVLNSVIWGSILFIIFFFLIKKYH